RSPTRRRSWRSRTRPRSWKRRRGSTRRCRSARMPERRRAGKRRAAASRPAPARKSRVPVRGPVRILFLDVDGTLTDGVIGETPDFDFRNFWVRDGLALQWARDLGVLPVSISGRASRAVEARMKDLGLEYYVGIADKVAVAEKILARENATWGQCVMVGDDLP